MAPPRKYANESEKFAAYLRRLKAKAISLFGDACEHCGATEDDTRLEFAHLRRTGLNGQGRGMVARYRDIIRNRDAYARLCVGCHRDYDRGRGAFGGNGDEELPF